MIDLWPMLLPLAAISGWWAAKRGNNQEAQVLENTLSREYVLGLNYLLNEQQDKAVDVFIRLLEVDSETVETHLALGSLFRRRGEVDRAIRIHQNLIARPQLNSKERKEALLALGQDYMSAGFFDRAERIFSEVLSLGGKELQSLQALLTIYQQEKSWENALSTVQKIASISGQNHQITEAHYYCEIAEQNIRQNDLDKAYLAVQKALQTDKQSVRASLLMASLDIKQQRLKKAIRVLKRVASQDPVFVSEIVEPLVLCHQECDTMPECIAYLKELLVQYPTTSILCVIADYIRQEQSFDFAIDFFATELSRYPSIRGLNKLIFWHLESAPAQGKVREKLQMLYGITSRLLLNKPVYRCEQCGYSGKHLHWHCPSCKQWGKMKPIHGLEGD